jgi:anti-sigma factor RsiW
MTREEIEFLISQHLDGTLSREEEAKVRELLASSEEAREILAEDQKLDGVLKSQSGPAVKWDVLAEKISQAVDAVGEAEAVSEVDEVAATEYLDGTLSTAEMASIETRIANEPGLAAVVEEYRALDGALKNAMPMPAVKWDLLAERLSEAVDEQSQRGRMFIGNWLKQPMRLAAAAVIIIALGVGILITLTRGGGKPAVASVVVDPPEKPAAGPAVAQVDFDMSPTLAQSGTDWYSAGDVVAMPSTLDVAFTTPVLPDTSSPF